MKKKNFKLTALCICIIMTSSLFFCSCSKTFAQKDTYEGRVFYEIFVRSFSDSNGDGIGDLKGITNKLDYLKSLGIKGIWLTPINSSNSYHGYDVTDYYSINKDFGSIEDYKKLIKEAHKRDIKVIMDLVLNHTSKEHSWFKEALKDKNSKYRDYYIFSKDMTKLQETSSMGTSPWTKEGDECYYSLFSDDMPDLNYDNINVRNEAKNIAKFYLNMGVDGFRLDAAKWIYEDTNKNILWWKEFEDYVKSINKRSFIVGEVWCDEEERRKYENSLDSTFNFTLADNIVKSISDNNMASLSSAIGISYSSYRSANKKFIDSPFLTNHDMDRVMSKLNSTYKCKIGAAVLFTLPGTPFVYYGEETGMGGVKPDNNIRQPFTWDNKNKSKNTSWEMLDTSNDIDKVAVNVQDINKNSLLNFYRQLINIRNSSMALSYGNLEIVNASSSNVLSYVRTYEKEKVYLFVNNSKKESTEKIGSGFFNVLYSNKRGTGYMLLTGKIKLKPNEIIIIKK